MQRRGEQLPISSESYYEHDCMVSIKGDILYTAIKGTGWTASLRRWWRNLFLLAHDDERCRKYYKSSHALKLDRARQYRKHRSRIHPLSKFRKYWEYTILVTSILNRLFMHHNSSVVYPSIPMPYPVIGVVLEFILLIDIGINFMTGYIDREEKVVVLDRKMGCMHYCSTKFFFHVLSSMPYQSVLLARYRWDMGCKVCKSNQTVSIIKILSTFGYYRVVDSTQLWAQERRSLVQTHCLRFLRIGVLAALARLQVLSFVDAVNIILMIKTNHVDANSYLGLVLMAQKYLQPSLFLTFELSLLLRPFLIINIRPDMEFRILDQILTMVSITICGIFYTWSLVECFRLIYRVHFTEDELHRQKDMMKNLLKNKQIPSSMVDKVLEYYNYKLNNINIINVSNDLLHSLPRSLYNEIILINNEGFIKRIPYFAGWPPEAVEWITLTVQEEFFMAGDVIVSHASQGEGLIVVKAGLLAVYSSEKTETGHLIDGDYFGEISLVTDSEVSASEVVAVTQCQVLIVKKEVFRKLMRNFPDLFYEMRTQLLEKYKDQTGVQVKNDVVTKPESMPSP